MIKEPLTEKPQTFQSLQLWRAVACLLVVFYHNSLSIFALDKYWGADPMHGLFNFGAAGVDMFFVLSGFIIFYIHKDDIGRPERLMAFIWKRFIRIYPIYWLILIPLTAVYFLKPSFGGGFETEPLVLLSSFSLMHAGTAHTVLPVAWTLFHEVLFYGAFGLLIWNPLLGGAAMAAWFAVSTSAMLLPAVAPDAQEGLGMLFSPMHILFLMGMGSAWPRTASLSVFPRPWVDFIFGLVVFIGVGLEEDYVHQITPHLRMFLYGLSSVILLNSGIRLEGSGKLRVPRFLSLIGDASYSIYLVHFPLLSLLAKVLTRPILKEHLPILAAYVIMVGIAVVAGILTHLCLERSVMGWMRRKLS